MRAADIDAGFVPLRHDDVLTEELDGECVILAETAGRIHHLNASATVVWSCFDGSGTIAEIASDLATELGTDPEPTEADVLALARELGARGLLAGVTPEVDDLGPDGSG